MWALSITSLQQVAADKNLFCHVVFQVSLQRYNDLLFANVPRSYGETFVMDLERYSTHTVIGRLTELLHPVILCLYLYLCVHLTWTVVNFAIIWPMLVILSVYIILFIRNSVIMIVVSTNNKANLVENCIEWNFKSKTVSNLHINITLKHIAAFDDL